MSFIETAYKELKAIDPNMTTDKFSTDWLNKCSSYYRANKARGRDMTLHAMMCFLHNLGQRAHALRMNNNNQLLHERAAQYDQLLGICRVHLQKNLDI